MPLIWLNGALIDSRDARIDPADRGFLLGDGVFETVRARAGSALHLPRHLARLRRGAHVLGIEPVWNDTQIEEAVGAILATREDADAALRITLSRGPAARGVLPVQASRPTLLISGGPLPEPAPPARVVVARSTRRNEASPLSRIKSLNYLDSIIARREAAARAADDAILLNTRGQIAESTAANVFLLRNGAIETPPVADGALPGIFRERLIEAGLAREQTLLPADLSGADAVFLGNSLGVRLVIGLDEHPIGTGAAGWEQVRRRLPPEDRARALP